LSYSTAPSERSTSMVLLRSVACAWRASSVPSGVSPRALRAADYYYRASAMRVIDRIRVPTLILSAEDDPFVPSIRSAPPRWQAIHALRRW
jgi:pimeloyl-ACP methyl ester carboxylesterase